MSSIVHEPKIMHAAESTSDRQLVAWSLGSAHSLMLMLGEQERRDRFGYALQEALKARGVSERQLAATVGVDPRQVAKWRSGRGLPDLYQTQAIIDALRVSEDLFRDPPAVPKPPEYPIERYLLEAASRGARRGQLGPRPDTPDDTEPDGLQLPPRS